MLAAKHKQRRKLPPSGGIREGRAEEGGATGIETAEAGREAAESCTHRVISHLR